MPRLVLAQVAPSRVFLPTLPSGATTFLLNSTMASAASASQDATYFEKQRALLVNEVAAVYPPYFPGADA